MAGPPKQTAQRKEKSLMSPGESRRSRHKWISYVKAAKRKNANQKAHPRGKGARGRKNAGG